jgi:hypothetical protein
MRIPDDRPGPAIEDLRRYGRSLADSVPPSQADAIITRALSARTRGRRSRRLFLVLAIVGLLAVSNVGLAVVSDNAAPGDFLYPFDRGYEWARDLFGPRSRATERLSESQVLDQRGHTEDAVQFLRDELTPDSPDRSLLIKGIAEIERRADRAQGTPPDPLPSTTSPTAPGLIDDEQGQPHENPSVTAPGQVRNDAPPPSPSENAPGQNKDVEKKLKPNVPAPRSNKDLPQAPTVSDGGGRGNIKDQVEP